MVVTLTAFGQFTRKLRIDHREFLKDMAARLGVTVSYLSAVETGRRNTPFDWVDRLADLYNLSHEDVEQLKRAVLDSRMHDKVDISHLSLDDKQLIQDVVTGLPTFTSSKREQLRHLIGDYKRDG